MTLLTDEHVGTELSVHTMSGNKNWGRIVYVDSEIIKLVFFMTNKDKGPDKREMTITIRQDRIESIGELTS